MAEDKAEEERLRETDRKTPRAGHMPRADGGLGAGHLELEGCSDRGPEHVGKPGGWEGLSVPLWALRGHRGSRHESREWAGGGEGLTGKLMPLDTG